MEEMEKREKEEIEQRGGRARGREMKMGRERKGSRGEMKREVNEWKRGKKKMRGRE